MTSFSFWLRCIARNLTRRMSSSGNSSVVFINPYSNKTSIPPRLCGRRGGRVAPIGVDTPKRVKEVVGV